MYRHLLSWVKTSHAHSEAECYETCENAQVGFVLINKTKISVCMEVKE